MQDQFLSLYRRHSVSAGSGQEKPVPKILSQKLPQENYKNTLHKYSNNEWMKKHGKGDFIDFDSKQRTKIRQIFKQLDKDGSGTLCVDELYEPLLALGLVENKQQVLKMMNKVDTNRTGLIEFDEFIKILKQNSTQNDTLVNFFKDLSDEKIFDDMKDLPFNLFLLSKRRELMMQGYMGKNNTAREHGKKIMNAFAEELKDKQEEKTKQERLQVKQENKAKNYIERQNCIRSAVQGLRETRMHLINIGKRPSTASKKPMTRRDILKIN